MQTSLISRRARAFRVWFSWFAVALGAATASAQSISYAGGSVTQNFNSLPSSGTFTFAGSGPFDLSAAPISAASAAGWSLARTGGSGSVALFFFGTGSSTTGGVYSFGAAGNSERALGTLQSGANVAAIGAVFVNSTAVTITQFTLSYTGEQWRKGGSTAQDRLIFEYSVGGASITSGTFTAATPLDFLGPIFNAGAGLLDGNAAANRTAISATVSGLSWAPGQQLVIRWSDFNVTGSDDGLAIDDVTFTTPAGSGPVAPAVISTVPASGATNVSVSAPLTVTFNQAVNVTGSWFALSGATSGAHTAAVSGGPSAFTLTPAVAFAGGETVTLNVLAAQVTDQATGTLHPAADYTTSFTTLSATPLAIHTVQGSGTTSPFATTAVTVQGVVVASFQGAGKIGGYYIEAPTADQDADPATSEGIYVFDNANAVAVGDLVTVTGTVVEFGTAPNSETEISPVSSFMKNSTGNPLPASVTVSLPFPGTGYAERYEGMLVTLPQTLTVTDNFDYGHFGELVLSNGRLSTPTNIVAPGAPAQAQAAANLLNQLTLDDGVSTTYPDPTPFLTSADPLTATRRAGSTIAGLTGILDNKFGTYVIEPTSAPVFVDANPRGAAPNPGGTLHVAIGNVLNFFNGNGAGGGFPTSRGADTFAEYQRQRAKIIAGILGLAPDIMGLTEVENDGFGALSAIQDIVNGLNAGAPGGTIYAFVDVGLPAIGTDLITCGFIYKTNTVSLVGAPAVNLNGVFNRPPIAQTFRQVSTGEKLTITINHFKSKGSGPSSGPDSDQGDGQAAWNVTRTNQANALTAWLATNPTGDADPDVLIIGDLNSYAKENPITAIKGAGYANFTETFEGAGGYSYAFNAEFGHLDHALGTASLAAQTTGAESWHVNSDEPVYYDYNVENKNAAQQAINVGTGYRYSDHDPVVIGLNLASGPPTQTYSAWASANGLTAANNAFTADPDADAIVNLLEYFIGLNPTVSDPAGVPTGSVESSQFVFRFNRAKTVTGVTSRVVASSDLATWTPVAPDPAVESSTASTETFIAALPMSSPRLFARLEITSGGTTVATVPVGYLKNTLAPGTPALPATTVFGVPLDDPAPPPAGIRAGRIESFTANTLVNASGGWSANLAAPTAPWFVRLTSGPSAGKLLDITSNTATTLTVSGADLTTLGLTAGTDTFELLPVDTLSTLFGSSTLLGGVSASAADNVQVRSGTSWLVYFYDTNLGFWRRTIGPATNSNNVLIRPTAGVQIVRRAPAVTLTFTGRVPATAFRVAVNNASSTVIHAGFPTDTTLGSLAIQTLLPGWRSAATAAAADTVSLFNGTAWIGYFHNGSFWQPTTGPAANSDALAIPAGGLLTIQRPGTATGATDLVRAAPYSL